MKANQIIDEEMYRFKAKDTLKSILILIKIKNFDNVNERFCKKTIDGRILEHLSHKRAY